MDEVIKLICLTCSHYEKIDVSDGIEYCNFFNLVIDENMDECIGYFNEE
jgi:hypothetical protein